MKRSELAERAQLSDNFIRQVENGEKGLSSKSICNISEALNVTTDCILRGVDYLDDQLTYTKQALVSFTDEENSIIGEICKIVVKVQNLRKEKPST